MILSFFDMDAKVKGHWQEQKVRKLAVWFYTIAKYIDDSPIDGYSSLDHSCKVNCEEEPNSTILIIFLYGLGIRLLILILLYSLFVNQDGPWKNGVKKMESMASEMK